MTAALLLPSVPSCEDRRSRLKVRLIDMRTLFHLGFGVVPMELVSEGDDPQFDIRQRASEIAIGFSDQIDELGVRRIRITTDKAVLRAAEADLRERSRPDEPQAEESIWIAWYGATDETGQTSEWMGVTTRGSLVRFTESGAIRLNLAGEETPANQPDWSFQDLDVEIVIADE